MTPCECPLAGYCPRHKITKTAREFELCKTRITYFELWEAGDSPQHWREKNAGAVSQVSSASRPRRTPLDETPEDWPCPHRLPVVRTDACDICGSRGQPFPVYGCDLHGECSIAHLKSGVKSCIACADRPARATETAEHAQAH